jgi:hypothetical protein
MQAALAEMEQTLIQLGLLLHHQALVVFMLVAAVVVIAVLVVTAVVVLVVTVDQEHLLALELPILAAAVEVVAMFQVEIMVHQALVVAEL